MRTIHYHIEGIKLTFETFAKGKFLLYFLPGIAVTFVFMSFFYFVSWIFGIFSFVERIPLLGSYIVHGAAGIFGFLWSQIHIFFILTILSPINTLVSAKFANYLTGEVIEGGCARFFNEIIRMIFIVILALILQFGILILWYTISYSFGLSFLNHPVSLILSSFFIGLSFYDCSLERYNIGVFGTLAFAISNSWGMIVTGLLFSFLYMIPLIGIMVAPIIITMISTVVYLKYRGTLPAHNKILNG